MVPFSNEYSGQLLEESVPPERNKTIILRESISNVHLNKGAICFVILN